MEGKLGDALDETKRLEGLNLAKSWNFTEAQYEEALKRIDSPDCANQLMRALVDISRTCDTSAATTIQKHHTCYVTKTRSGTNHPQHQQTSDEKTGFSSAAFTSTSATNHNNNTNSNGQKDLSSSSSSALSSSFSSSYTSFPSSSDHSLECLLERLPPLRKIYVDGSNVARTHGKDVMFSWKGIKLCVQWFASRHHRVKVFVPTHRCSTADETVLNFLDDLDALIKTPEGCNDDLFVIEAAKQNNGVIVSNDFFRNEKRFNEDMQQFILLNRLPYVFVDDLFIPASDPRGRSGPTLNEFLMDTPKTKLFKVNSHQHQRNQRKGYSVKYIRNNYHLSLKHSNSLPTEPSSRCNQPTNSSN